MSEAEIKRIEILLTRLIAGLEERCPQRWKIIEGQGQDLDRAFSRLRKLESKVTRLMVLYSLVTPVLTAALVRVFI